MFSLFCEHDNLEYVHVHVIYRGNQAEYRIRIRVAASQEFLNICSTRKLLIAGLPRPYKIIFHVHPCVHESILLLLPPLPPLPHTVHYYITTIVQNTTPFDPPCVCHTPYNIGNGNSLPTLCTTISLLLCEIRPPSTRRVHAPYTLQYWQCQ